MTAISTVAAVLALPAYTDRQADIGTAVLVGLWVVLAVALGVRWWRRR
ncbi:hypothetical protein [Mycolicibacterium aubagnense]|nr:hypothetical protein [Mycolicibacterium aubagnense]WGI35920.1 hypothetical protein QDT91_28310 [Mycolicibacterium aubagnense]